MTVNNQTTEVTYTGDGSRVDFPITFAFIDPVQVLWTPAGGAVIEDGADNWIVRMDSPPADGEEVRIYRDTPITQETQYNPYDAFPAESHEAALDKLTMITQELESKKGDMIWIDENYVSLDGDTMHEGNTGIDMSGGKITGLADAVDPSDAVSRAYMEANAVAGGQGEPGPPGPGFDEAADFNATGTWTMSNMSNVFYGDGSNLTGLPATGVALDNKDSWNWGQYNQEVEPANSNAGTATSRFVWNPEQYPVVSISDSAAPMVSVFPQAPTVDGMFVAITWVSHGSSQVWALGDTFDSKIGPPEDSGSDVTRVYHSRGDKWIDVA